MTTTDAIIDRETELKQKRICRFCMTVKEPLSNIYSNENRIKTRVPLPLQIMACVSIEVFTNDGMPSLICDPCRLVMDYTYRFKQMCKKADTTLKQYPLTGKWQNKLEHPQFPEELIKLKFPPATAVARIALKRSADTAADQPLTKRRPDTATTTSPTSKSPTKVQAIKLSPQPPLRLSPESLPHKESSTQVLLRKKQAVQQVPKNQKTFATTSVVKAPPPKLLNSAQPTVKILNKEAPSNKVVLVQKPTEKEFSVSFELSELGEDEPKVLKAVPVATHVFPCPKCERSFPLRQLLTIHMTNHQRERSFECDICSKRFFSKYDLGKHTPIHTGNKPFVCVICNKAFSRSTLLSRHERIHTDQPKFMCNICNRPFLSLAELEKHSVRHDKKRPFPCQVCPKSFAFKQGLERHEIIHAKVQPHKCEHCEVSFSTPSKLARHLTAHAGRRPYPCRLCPKSYLLSHHLTRHVRSHKDVNGTFKCFNCDKMFKSRSELVYHSAIHATQDLVCPLCEECFESLEDVTEHIKSHTEGEQFACEFCDLIFTTEERLCSHSVEEHADEHETYAHDERTRVIKREVDAVVDPPLADGEECIEELIIDTISDNTTAQRILNYTVKPIASIAQDEDEVDEDDEEDVPFDEIEVDEHDGEIEYEEERFEEEHFEDAQANENDNMDSENEIDVQEDKFNPPSPAPIATPSPPPRILKSRAHLEKGTASARATKQIPIAQQKLEQSLQAALRATAATETSGKSAPVTKLPAKAAAPTVYKPNVSETPVKKTSPHVDAKTSPILSKVNFKDLPAGISVKRKVAIGAPPPPVVSQSPAKTTTPPKQTKYLPPATRAKTTISVPSKEPVKNKTLPSDVATSKSVPPSSSKSMSPGSSRLSPGSSKSTSDHNKSSSIGASKSIAKPGTSKPVTRKSTATSKNVVSMMVGDEMVQVQKVKMTKAQVAAMAREGKIEMKDGQVFLKQKKSN